jgi:uncharacterized repeat protein (TIGR03847 family)
MIRIFDNVERFVCGTVGQPGERAFFIQVRSTFASATVSVEKSQVQALAERLRYMVKEIKLMHPLIQIPAAAKDVAPLDTPIEDDFRVGSMALFFDDDNELIQVDLRESDGDEAEDAEDDLMGDIEIVRIFIKANQALIFADRADALMGAGRLPCPFCAMPINSTGHLCARANGYRR